MFVSEFRLERLGMDQRDGEEKHGSGELMEKQGFGMLIPTCTHSRRACVDCGAAWGCIRVHDAYAWKARSSSNVHA